MFASIEDLVSVLFFAKSDDLSRKLANVSDHSVTVNDHCHQRADLTHEVAHQ